MNNRYNTYNNNYQNNNKTSRSNDNQQKNDKYQNNNKTSRSNDNQQKNDKYQNIINTYNKINESNFKLNQILTVEEINLPEGMAYMIANDLANDSSPSKLNTNQLRKVFEQIKESEKYEVNEARNNLYKTLPLVAYAVGRGNCPKEFFKLLDACIKPNKLLDDSDIKCFIEFLTSIVAYVKYIK